MKMKIQVVILAGGMATRLGDLTKYRPKSLVEIHGKPFLAYQLELLKAHEITDIVLCIGHLGGQIREAFGNGSNYGVHLTYSLEEEPLGTAGALKNAAPYLNDIFCVMYGDSYLSFNFTKVYAYFLTQHKLGLDTVFRNNDAFDTSNIAIRNNLVARYSKTEKSADMVYIDYGAVLFRKEVLQLIPENRFYPLEDLFLRLIERGQLLALEIKERFYEIGSPQGLKDFEVFAQLHLKK
jgi:NDP-sugar pyrophosphorylase family protein